MVEEGISRASPILGLRPRTTTTPNRRSILANATTTASTSFDENCITRRSNHLMDCQPPRLRPIVRGNPALYASPLHRNVRQRRFHRLVSHLRTRATNIRRHIPQVNDVNDIDKWSRVCFPVLFILFNATYWPYYISRPQSSS